MANFSSNINLNEIVPKGLRDENLALDMIRAGQNVLKGTMQIGANRHRYTGAMADSIKATKPNVDKNGTAVGRVNITGKDKDGRSNALKAMFVEFGTKHMPARPFVRPAVKSSESAISSAMKLTFDRKV